MTYNGVEVLEGWPDQLEEAQGVKSDVIGGKEHARARYGDETKDWGADRRPCRDGAVIKGQFHVLGCGMERCPARGGQVITCACPYRGDEVKNGG